MSVHHCIRNLERARPHRAVRCIRCGKPMDRSKDRAPYTCTVEFDDGSAPEPDEECMGCGRRMVFRIKLEKGG